LATPQIESHIGQMLECGPDAAWHEVPRSGLAAGAFVTLDERHAFGGESGTGKEVVASVIHRGAFTGAVESFKGAIRAAEGDTLFLDEIGDLERMMREGRFREDLFHRLNVVHFRVPHSRSVIQNRDLSPKFFEERDTPPPVASDDARALSVRVDRPLSEIAQDVEIAALTYAMRATNGRMDLAAKRLGLSRKGLYLKRLRLGL